MAAGEIDSVAVRGGIEFLLRAPREDGKWRENILMRWVFPRVFYLRYHGYSIFFPIWTLARYRNLKKTKSDIPRTDLSHENWRGWWLVPGNRMLR